MDSESLGLSRLKKGQIPDNNNPKVGLNQESSGSKGDTGDCWQYQSGLGRHITHHHYVQFPEHFDPRTSV